MRKGDLDMEVIVKILLAVIVIVVVTLFLIYGKHIIVGDTSSVSSSANNVMHNAFSSLKNVLTS